MPQQEKGLTDAQLEKLSSEKGLTDAELNSIDTSASDEWGVARTMGSKVLEGAKKLITGGYMKSPQEQVNEIFTPTSERLKNLIKGPAATSIKGAAALAFPNTFKAPSEEEFEGAAEQAGANAAGLATGELATKGVPAAIKSARYSQGSRLLTKLPEDHLRTSLKPDLDNEGLKLAGSQLKAGEEKIGKPVKDTDTVKEAAKAQFQQELMPQRRQIIDPQKDVTVPGSRRILINAKISSIPADIRPDSPEYARAIQKIKDSVPADLTIGELEQMNSSLNQQTRAYHQAKLGQALGKEENLNSAIDIASEAATRSLMEKGMQQFGLGGYNALKEVNKRIGSLIKIEDANRGVESTARVEAATPKFRRIGKTTINMGIANAMKDWNYQPEPINPNMRTPAGPARMIPAHTSTDLGVDTESTQAGVGAYNASSRPTGGPNTFDTSQVTATEPTTGVGRRPKGQPGGGQGFRYYKGESKPTPPPKRTSKKS